MRERARGQRDLAVASLVLRAHRERAHGRPGSPARVAAPAPTPRRATGDRRLRHRLLVAHLPAGPAARRGQDRPVASSATSSAGDDTIVRSMIDLGHNLGLDVVAEGVESERIARPAARPRLRHRPGVPPRPMPLPLDDLRAVPRRPHASLAGVERPRRPVGTRQLTAAVTSGTWPTESARPLPQPLSTSPSRSSTPRIARLADDGIDDNQVLAYDVAHAAAP